MSWQDGFVPDNPTPQPVQSQGWQSSFVPDSQAASNNPDSFLQNPSMVNLGNAEIGALKDTAMMVPDSLSHIGKMVYGDWQTGKSDPIIDGVGGTASNLGSLLLPFLAVPEGSSEAMAAPETPEGVVNPTSGDIKLIKQKLDLAGITPQQYADALLNSSPQDFAGELGGEPLRMQTQIQAKVTGPAMQEARDAMRQRLLEAPQRTQQIIENSFFPSSAIEPTVGADPALAASPLPAMQPVSQMQQNLVDIKDKLPDLYDAANNSTINPTVGRRASLGIINTPAGQDAMKATATNFANQGINPEAAGIVIDPESGFHGLAPQVPVSTLSELSKSLGDQVERNPMTGAIEDHGSQIIEGMRQHITNFLSENSPEFDAANTNAAANFQGTNAFEMGRQLAHSAAGDKADTLMQRASDTFSPQELSYLKAGYAQGLSDSATGAPIGGGSPASRIAKGTVTQTASDIIGPSAAQKFADALMQEKNRVHLAQSGLYGSNTAETLTANVPDVPTSAEGVLSAAANKVMDFVNAGKNQRIAQLLYATSPEQKSILAREVLK